MSYDISLVDPVTKETLIMDSPHQMRGGTYGSVSHTITDGGIARITLLARTESTASTVFQGQKAFLC